MATQYSQLSQADRSRANLDTSRRQVQKATGLTDASFAPFARVSPIMAQAQEIVMKATENVISRVVVEEVDFQPLSYSEFKTTISGKTFETMIENDPMKVAEAIIADAAPEPVKEGKFCIEVELNGGWVRAVSDTSDRARDLEAVAKAAAMGNPQRKVRVVPSAGGRAVLRFRSKDGVLGSY
jgi:hypothetical protein